jgi:tetratricopeptide (TPR) repeat protein
VQSADLRGAPQRSDLSHILPQRRRGPQQSAAAVEAAKRAIRSYPDYPLPYRLLAAALGELGRVEEAKEALEKAIASAPASFDMYVRQRVPWMRPEDHARLKACARPAGRAESAGASP